MGVTSPEAFLVRRSLALVFLLALAAMALIACSDNDDGDSVATPTTTQAAATPTTPPNPGVAAAEAFLKIREDKDAAALAKLVTYTETACKPTSENPYWVPCPAGQPSGTKVPAVPWWGCHGAFSNTGTTEQMAAFFSEHPGEMKQILRFTPSGALDVFPAKATVAAILERPDEFAWAAVLDDDGRFYGTVTGCPADADELASLHFSGSQVLYPKR